MRGVTRRRRAATALGAVAGAVIGLLLAPAAVYADPPGPTDYDTEVVAITPDTPGLSARSIGGDSFFELTVGPSITVDVTVIGYRGEPYLRFRPDGTIEENRLAPTTYLNASRYGQEQAPPEADPEAAPAWRTVGHGHRWAWHDHRTHWMNAAHPPGAHPGDVVLEAVVPVLVGDQPVDISVRSTWRPAPSPVPAIAGAIIGLALAGAALAAGRNRRDRARRLGAVVLTGAAVAAIVVGLWQTWSVPSETGPPISAWALPATALVLAAAGILRRLSDFTAGGLRLVAAVQLVLWAAGRRVGLVRAILPTAAPFWLDRAVTAAVGCAAVVLGVQALWRIGRLMAPSRTARVAGEPAAPTAL